MLDVLRRNAGSWAIKIILSFIAITFIWWGVGTYSERGRDVAATVGGRKITTAELAQEVAGLEKVYRDVYGNAFTPDMAKGLSLRKQAMDTLVQRTLLLEEARKLGLTASDTEVQREIAATPAFQADGQFREDRYRSVLSYNRISAGEFEESKRQEITLRKMEGIIGAGARVSETEALDYYRLAGRKIRLLVASSDPGKSKPSAPPAEGEIAARFEQTKESYRLPARVKLKVARFEPAFFGRGLAPTEQEVRSFYEGNLEKFRSAEQRLVSRIVLPYGKKDKEAVRKKAGELLSEANKGKAEFEILARKYSRGKAGETWIARKDARQELADPLFSAPLDTVVGPVDTPGNYLLVRVNQIRFPETLPFPQVKERVVELLRHEKGKDLAVIKAYEAHGKASGKRDLASACSPYGVSTTETGWETEAQGATLPAAVLQEAMLLPSGEIGPVKTVGDTHFLFQVTAKEDSRIPPLAQVRDKVAASLQQEKRREAARAEAQRILSGARTAADLEKAARQAGLGVTTTGLFSPLGDKLPEGLEALADQRKALSSLTAKAPVAPKVMDANGRFLVLALAAEQQADEKEWAAKKDLVVKTLAEQKKARLTEGFIAEKRRQAKVEINPDALK